MTEEGKFISVLNEIKEKESLSIISPISKISMFFPNIKNLLKPSSTN